MEQPARRNGGQSGEQPDPVSAPASTLPLQRSAENRVIGGVCGGLAERTDIDPIVYRVLAAVLTLVGGAGLILYGAAMLLVPDARTGTAPLGRLFSGGRLRAAGVALAIVGLLVVLGGLTGVFGGASLSIVVIAILAVLVAHRRGVNFRDLFRGHPQEPRAGAAPQPAPPQQDAPPQVGEHVPAPQPFPPQAPAFQQQPSAPPGGVPAQQPPADEPTVRFGPPSGVPAHQQPPTDAPTVRMPVPPPYSQPHAPPYSPPQQPPEGYVDLSTLPPGAPQRPQRKEKLPSITGWVWLLAAVAGGMVAWLQNSGEIPGDVRVPLAVALAVLGLGLVVSAWVGRASVKAWGVLLTIALGAATILVGPMQDVRWQPAEWRPTSAAELAEEQPYDVGVGAAELDLTAVPIQKGKTYPVDVTMTAGRLVVVVPESAAVDLSVQCDQCAGDALGHPLDGGGTVDDRVEPSRSAANAPVIDLVIDATAGEVEVRRAP